MTKFPKMFSCLTILILIPVGSKIIEAGPAQTGAAQAQSPKSPAQTTKPPLAFGLEDGTPVKLRLQRTLSSADAHVNDTVDFDVLEEIKVKDVIVIPKGSLALGTVTDAQAKRRMARGGKLDVNIDSVRLIDGEKVALRAVKDVKGGGHTGAMTGAMVATGIVFFPAAPFFLFMHGKDITIPKGTEITAYINGDSPLDPAKFGDKGFSQASSAAQPDPQSTGAAPASSLSTVVVRSTPDGADITADGKFIGSTPSSVKLPPGDHTISIEKSGYKTWQRTMAVNPAGDITINIALEKNP